MSISSLSIILTVAWAYSRNLTARAQVVMILIILIDVFLLWAFCSNSTIALSTENDDVLIKKLKNHITGTVRPLSVSHSSLKFLENLIMKIKLNGSTVRDLICVVIDFAIVLPISETVSSYSTDLYSDQYTM